VDVSCVERRRARDSSTRKIAPVPSVGFFRFALLMPRTRAARSVTSPGLVSRVPARVRRSLCRSQTGRSVGEPDTKGFLSRGSKNGVPWQSLGYMFPPVLAAALYIRKVVFLEPAAFVAPLLPHNQESHDRARENGHGIAADRRGVASTNATWTPFSARRHSAPSGQIAKRL